MQISVNGKSTSIPEHSTVRQLLDQLDLPSTRVAVEVNKAIVRRAEHESHVLQQGDQVEVVTFVGGG